MRICIVLGTVALVAACGSAGREAAWEKDKTAQGTTTATSAASAGLAEAEEHWSKRDDRAELEKAIAGWEAAVAADPNNAELYVKLSRANYFLADGHLALEAQPNEEQELAVYTKGVNYGEQALLRLEPDFEATMRAGGEFEDAIKKISEKGVPAAYWYCANLGRFATRKGLSARLYYKDKIKAAMERVQALNPTYFYGAADRYLGGFYAVLPSIAGKDLDKSKAHFEASVQAAPEYLTTRAVQAEFLAVELDDEAMYKKLLDEVLAAQDGDNPDIAPENRAAKRKAQKMLSNIGEVF
jgi:hypothetical protein